MKITVRERLDLIESTLDCYDFRIVGIEKKLEIIAEKLGGYDV